jgi:hypothetical protein
VNSRLSNKRGDLLIRSVDIDRHPSDTICDVVSHPAPPFSSRAPHPTDMQPSSSTNKGKGRLGIARGSRSRVRFAPSSSKMEDLDIFIFESPALHRPLLRLHRRRWSMK